jgi:hypothetical protein
MNKPNFYRFGRLKLRNPHKIKVRKSQTGAMLAHFVDGELHNIWAMDSMLKLRRRIIPTYVLPAMRMPGRPSIKLREYKAKPRIRRGEAQS